jgi:hypothetical protein
VSSPLLQIVGALSAYADQRPLIGGYGSPAAESIEPPAARGQLLGDRRAHVRLRPTELDRPVLARLKCGPLLTLIDVSAGGALIETRARLTPGAHVLLEFLAPGTDQSTLVPSRVMRSQVAALEGHVRYRGACSFKQLLEIAEFMAGGHGRARGSAEDPTLGEAIHALRPLLVEPAGSTDCKIARLLDDIATMVGRSEAPRTLMQYVDEWVRRHVPLLTLRIRTAASERAASADSLSFAVPVSGAGGGQRVDVEFRPACTLNDSQVRLLEAGAYVMSLLYAWR